MMKEKLNKLDRALLNGLSEYGFARSKKQVIVRKKDECIQHISYVTTKTRGKEEVYINIYTGFKYEILNQSISFLQNEKYDERWATANINISSLFDSQKPYGFYINQDTDIDFIAQDLILHIKKYVFPFLDSCDTLEKYQMMLLKKDNKVILSTCILKRPEWNLLALSLLLKNQRYEDIINEYYDAFNRELSVLETAKEQIRKFDTDFKEKSNEP